MTVLKYNSGDNLKNIVDILREGKLVVYPTDTIYGIAANINNIQAIKRVFSAKNRSFDKAISVCFHDMEQLEDYVSLNEHIKEILGKALPGPYTFLLNKNEDIHPLLTADTSIVGVRIPDNIISYELTREFPITSTSANVSDFPTPNNIFEIQEQLGENIDFYINGGTLENNIPSTIIDLTKNKPRIIRKGCADEKVLSEILNINL